MPFEIGPDGRMEVFSLGEYKDYIWDLDGTLLDSYGAISGALKEEMLRRGVFLEESGILRKVKLCAGWRRRNAATLFILTGDHPPRKS